MHHGAMNMAPGSRVLSAKISKAENRGTHTYYVILVNIERGQVERQWSIRRRFSDFEQLHRELSQLFSTRRSSLLSLICGYDETAVDAPTIPRLPARKIWGMNDPQFVQKRGSELNVYLAELISRPAFAESALLHNFLQPEREADTALVNPDRNNQISALSNLVAARDAHLSPPPLKEPLLNQSDSSPLDASPKHHSPKQDEYAAMLNVDEECAMCCEEFTEVEPAILTGCNHKFHLHCIMDWKDRNTQAQCPMCRRKLTFADESMKEELEKDEKMGRQLNNRMNEADEEMARRLQEEEIGVGMLSPEFLAAAHRASRRSGGRSSRHRDGRH